MHAFADDGTIPGMRGISFTQNAIEDVVSSMFDDAIEEDVKGDLAEGMVNYWQAEADAGSNLEEDACPPEEQMLFENSQRNQSRRVLIPSGLPDWVYSSPFSPISVSVDEVDKELEPRLIWEVSQVIKNIEAEVRSNAVERKSTLSATGNGETSRTTLSRLDVVRAFLALTVLQKVRSCANRALSRRGHDMVEVEELLGITIFQVLCASYGASAKTLCSTKEKNCFCRLVYPHHVTKKFGLLLMP